ncbi:hydroxysqualene dehydroxylase HpnE [Massilia sp. PWRC2]|uniref:hydroxysqualene dehydroxylase HpnE n=1 Tax=Massilia sp. PWRC2 TaxID=2804626 RepID=UPI003CFB221E
MKGRAASAAGKRYAVIGGGWAGCAAAVELAGAGHRVTLFEAARTLGGRARAVSVKTSGAERVDLDNGQHILLGAYAATLALLARLGIERRDAFLTLPLQMRYPQGGLDGGMDFIAPHLPAPLHLFVALLRARGLSAADKLSLARFSTTARWMGWTLHHDCSVSELLERFDQTARLTALLWRPLCLAALNTAPGRASAQVFLAVLRDSLGAHRAASDMLLPRVNLSALMPQAAARYVEQRGGAVRLGAGVRSVVAASAGAGWRVDDGAFDGVVLATAPAAAAALLPPGSRQVRAQLDGFDYEAITTCYLQYATDLALPLPFCALLDDPLQGRHGQFVFDRGQLDSSQAGLLAVVISASAGAAAVGQAELARLLAAQLAAAFGVAALAAPRWHQVITEKRATFACRPALLRPSHASGLPALVLAGDYTAGDYPATLESAVRSGVGAARLLAAA